jgi:V8-like Glu-specific endopeptidase
LLGEWWSDETERVPKWYKEDCVIYEGLSGDSLLYGKSGRIGWHIFSEARYQRFWNSFKSFLRFYAEFQDIFHPLDFYSTERFLQRG